MDVQSHRSKAVIFILSVLLGFFGIIMPVYAGLDRASEAGLTPHKALYDIRLSSKKSGANVSDINGTMFYEWRPSCDAWVTTHRFDMTYDYLEVPSVRVTSDFSTYESFDGNSFNFSLQRKRGGLVFEEIRGSANLEGTDNAREAVYTVPQDLVFDLPDGTLFPMAHTLAVLEKVKSGNTFYNATIFDGSDAEGPVDINSFVAKEASYTPPEEYADNIDSGLVQSKGWKLRLAFFPLNSFEETADYEMSLIFHENGVISDMEVDYGDFSVTQKLRAIEVVEGSCSVENEKGVKEN